jgi:hypothetical protein
MTIYILIVTLHYAMLDNTYWHVNKELPYRFPTLTGCQAYFAEYAKNLRVPNDARLTYECEPRLNTAG